MARKAEHNMFDIRDYMWEIFCLSQTEDVHNVRLALDLFLMNVELGENRYEGTNLNYNDIMHKYLRLNKQERELQKEEFNAILDVAYKRLCIYWHNHNKEDFEFYAHEEFHLEELDHIQEELNKIALAKEKRKRRKRKKKKKKAPRIKKF